MPSRGALAASRRQVGIVFQSFSSDSTMTALKMSRCAGAAGNPMRRSARARAGFRRPRGRLHHTRRNVRRRAAARRLARALAPDPAIRCADEPTGISMRHRQADRRSLFTKHAERGMTLVLVTHDTSLASVATAWCGSPGDRWTGRGEDVHEVASEPINGGRAARLRSATPCANCAGLARLLRFSPASRWRNGNRRRRIGLGSFSDGWRAKAAPCWRRRGVRPDPA